MVYGMINLSFSFCFEVRYWEFVIVIVVDFNKNERKIWKNIKKGFWGEGDKGLRYVNKKKCKCNFVYL